MNSAVLLNRSEQNTPASRYYFLEIKLTNSRGDIQSICHCIFYSFKRFIHYAEVSLSRKFALFDSSKAVFSFFSYFWQNFPRFLWQHYIFLIYRICTGRMCIFLEACKDVVQAPLDLINTCSIFILFMMLNRHLHQTIQIRYRPIFLIQLQITQNNTLYIYKMQFSTNLHGCP